MSSHERRATPRHVPLYSRIFLAWEEPGGLKFTMARLSDLSSGGAGISVQGPLPEEGPVWIGLEGTPMRDWARGRIVRVVKSELGMRKIGVKFLAPCPLFFFKRAIWGGTPMEAPASRPRPRTPPTSPRSFWRARATRAADLILNPDRSGETGWSIDDREVDLDVSEPMAWALR